MTFHRTDYRECLMDKRAFDRAREQFKKKTKDLSEEELAEAVEKLVNQSRLAPPPPPKRLLGVTYTNSSTRDVLNVSLGRRI